ETHPARRVVASQAVRLHLSNTPRLPSSAGAESDGRRRRAWSLAWKLPLLMTGLLAVLLAATLGLTYITLTRAALATAEERLQRAGDQLGNILNLSMGQVRTRMARAGADSSLRLAVAAHAAAEGDHRVDPSDPALIAARASLERQLTAADDGLTVELWSDEIGRAAGRERV